LSNSQAILQGLESATLKADVRRLIETYGYDEVKKCWPNINPAQRAALHLINYFEGAVIVTDQNGIINRKLDSI
jgi:hypothetical protein